MQTTTSRSQTTRRFFPSDADREWASREFDLAADRRIAACRTAKIQRSRGPSAEDLDFAAAMFAEADKEREERRAEDQAAFRREQGMDVSRWHDHPSPKTPGVCQLCEECGPLNADGICEDCDLGLWENSTTLQPRSFPGAL